MFYNNDFINLSYWDRLKFYNSLKARIKNEDI